MSTSDREAELRRDALEFFLAEDVLTFGDFTLKSGRTSPYFFNTGRLSSGDQLRRLGELYARRITTIGAFDDATVVFGSAYKGIPIAVTTAVALSGIGRGAVRAVSDRKEAKTHGDAGSFLGVIHEGDRAVIVDDVITTGGTKFEAIEKLRQAQVMPTGLVIAFDRAEPIDDSGITAREAFEERSGLTVFPLLSIHDVIDARSDLAERLQDHLRSFA